MFGTTCPTCNSVHIRRSRRDLIERILLPYASACRCSECGRRFYSISRRIRQQTESPNVIEICRARKVDLEHRLRWSDPSR